MQRKFIRIFNFAITSDVNKYKNLNHQSIKMVNTLNPIRSFLSFIHSGFAAKIFSVKRKKASKINSQKWASVEVFTYDYNNIKKLNLSSLKTSICILYTDDTCLYQSSLSLKSIKSMAMFLIYKRSDKTMEQTKKWWGEEHAPIILEKQSSMKFQYYAQSMVLDSECFNMDSYTPPNFIAFLGYKNQPSMFANSLKPASFKANIKLIKDEPKYVIPQQTSFIFGQHTILT